MRRLLDWLARDVSFWEITVLVSLFILVDFVLSIIVIVVLECFNVNLPQLSDKEIRFLVKTFPYALFICAFIEELFFRFIPLVIAIRFWGVSSKVLFVVLLLSSVIFGWVHGSFFNVFVQGGVGILLSLLFLKCGGFQGKYFKALFVTTVAHFSSNSFVILIYLMGQS